MHSVRRIDDVYVDDILSFNCGFPVQAHDVGTSQAFNLGDLYGSTFSGKTTYTNLDNGTFVIVRTAARTKLVLGDANFTLSFMGLDFQIRTSHGTLVSAGRGTEDFNTSTETATPHIGHFSEVICPLLASG